MSEHGGQQDFEPKLPEGNSDSPGLAEYEMGPGDTIIPDSSVPSIWESVLVPSPQREGR